MIINVHCPTEDKDEEIKDQYYETLEQLMDQFASYDTKIVMGDYNAKIGREEIFRPTIGTESLHENCNDNGVRVVNFAAARNLIVKSTYFKHRDIHKATWTSPDGNTHNQIDHFLIDRRRHTNVTDVRTYRGVDCSSDHFLVIAKLRARLSVSREQRRAVGMESFNVAKLRVRSDRERYQIEIKNRFQALSGAESGSGSELDDDPDRLWKIH